MGDFNHDLDQLHGWEILKSAGWKDAQDVACELCGREHTTTYRETSITDHILLSPEMLPFLEKVDTWPWFADHACSTGRST